MIDTHCHLTDPTLYSELDTVIAEAAGAGVDRFVVPSTDIKNSKKVVSMARRFSCIWPAVGIHPMWSPGENAEKKAVADAIDSLADLIQANRDVVRAIGEIGIDPEPGVNDPPVDPGTGLPVSPRTKEIRKALFVAQLELARELGLPVILHWRGLSGFGARHNTTVSELVDILQRIGTAPAGGILHAFTGSAETGAELRKLGYLRGVAGTFTMPKTPRITKALEDTPLENMVIETDAPFLANSLHGRGQVRPADLELVVKGLARMKGISEQEVISISDNNAAGIFGMYDD